MRGIKFRAWDKTKKMFLPFNVFAAYTALPDCLITMVEDWENYRVGEFGYTNYFELMQFTGLKDKNGKEIYAGDVIKHKFKRAWQTDEHTSTVVWEQDWCCYYGYDGRAYHRLRDDVIYEVIGNIHENPELLKQI